MEFLACCEEIARAVEDIVRDMAKTPEGRQVVRTGAAGTPTRKIDQVAEDYRAMDERRAIKALLRP